MSSESEVLVDRILQRFYQSAMSSRQIKVETDRIEMTTPALEPLYGVPVYVIGEGYVGQLRRFYYIRGLDDRRWIIETCPQIIIYGRKGDLIFPVVVMGLPTIYATRKFDYYLIEETRPIRTVECNERDIINLERVMKLEDPVLLIDKYGLYKNRVPQNYWLKYIELQNMVANLQKTVYDLEHDRSELITALQMRESENAVLRDLIENLRNQLTKLRSEVMNYYTEYIRLKQEVRLQSEIADTLESMFSRLESMLHRLETMAVRVGRREEKREEREEEEEEEVKHEEKGFWRRG